MEPDQISKAAPLLMFSLEIDPTLHRAVTSDDPLNDAVHGALVRALSTLMETLGIPGEPVVRITALQKPPSARFMRVIVDGRVLRYSDEILRSVYCWLNGSPMRADVSPTEILAWLGTISEPGASEADRQKLAAFLSQTSLEIIKAQPSLLLGQSQLAAYVASLPVPAIEDPTKWPPDPAWLLPILSRVLNLRISIANKDAVVNALAQSVERPWSDACEALIDVLHSDAVEIHLREEYLRELTTTDAKNRVGLLAFLRDGLFTELGILYPDFRLVLDAGLAPRQFMFKLNHFTCVPQIGLGPGECLVNDTPEALKQRFNITATAAGNPATALANSITSLEHKNALEREGWTTWDQMGYLILSLAASLRRSGACFVHRRFTERQLEVVRTAFPALAKTALSVVSVEQITAVLRGLAAEELPIRNLKLVLERLADYQFRNEAGHDLAVDDAPTAVEGGNSASGDYLTQLTAFVRAGMKREISGKYSKETNTLVAYLMDHGLEELLSRHGLVESDEKLKLRLEEEQLEQIVEAIRKEIASLPPTVQVPAILTTKDVRGPLREAIAFDFPRISVLAYQELVPGLNVQPIARISWSTQGSA